MTPRDEEGLMKIWLVFNDNSEDGRGGPGYQFAAAVTSKAEAEKIAKSLWITRIDEVEVYNTFEEFVAAGEAVKRKVALSKLSDEERRLLGLQR